MQTVIIKYNAGNIQSVLFAMERIGVQARVTDDAAEIQRAEKVIFPGVGEASTAMAYLRERGLDAVIRNLTQPVLGICLGMQLLCRHSAENDTACLDIFDNDVQRFNSDNRAFKVPQMGWNRIAALRSPLFEGVPENSHCYFVHSYYAPLGGCTVATTDYIQPYSAALQRDNFYGVQFHPEKSSTVGERILSNFIHL